MHSLKCHISGDKVLSPGVGRFYRRIQKTECEAGWKSIGVLLRLDEYCNLLIPAEFSVREVVVPDGVEIMSGDELATSDLQPPNQAQQMDVIRIFAPTDGFIRIVDGGGNLFKHAGDALHHGEIIAILELMKIRMEIAFDGADGCEFERYLCSDQTAVHRGTPIAQYYKK